MSKKKKEVVETSEVTYESPKEWKFFVNDQRVTEEEYITIMNEHLEWVKKQEALQTQAIEDIKPDRKRKKK